VKELKKEKGSVSSWQECINPKGRAFIIITCAVDIGPQLLFFHKGKRRH